MPPAKKTTTTVEAPDPAKPKRLSADVMRANDIIGCGVDRIADVSGDVVTLDGEARKIRIAGVNWSYIDPADNVED